MSRLLPPENFTGFGPSRYLVAAVPCFQVLGPRLRSQVRRDCPRKPGVYGMLDSHGDLIYVGKAKRLRTRLLSYFRPKSRDPKAGRILASARGIVWEVLPSEFVALLRELELIRRWRPRWNVQGQPHRRRPYYICLGRSPAPYAFLSLRPRGTVAQCFGPLPFSRLAQLAVRYLNDAFQLRDCPQAQTMLFADEAELFPQSRSPGCLRHDIGTCLAPCAALCSSRRYESQVGRALAFLRGEDDRLLPRLEAAMKQAARSQAFERAAALKQQLDALHWLAQRLERLRSAQAESSFIYPVTDAAEQCHWYVIQRGFVRAIHFAPASADGCDALIAQLREQYSSSSNPWGSASSERIEERLLVLSWFRRHPSERNRTISLDAETAQAGL